MSRCSNKMEDVRTKVPLDQAAVKLMISTPAPRLPGHPRSVNTDQQVQMLVGVNSLTSILDYPLGSGLYKRLVQFCVLLYLEIIRPASVELHNMMLSSDPVDNQMVKRYMRFCGQVEETLKGNIPIPPNITPTLEAALKEAVNSIVKMTNVDAAISNDLFASSQPPETIPPINVSCQDKRNAKASGTTRCAANDKNEKLFMDCDPFGDYKLQQEADKAKRKEKEEILEEKQDEKANGSNHSTSPHHVHRRSIRLAIKKRINATNDHSSRDSKSKDDGTTVTGEFITYQQRQSSCSSLSSPPSLSENDEETNGDEYDDTDNGSSTNDVSEDDSDDDKPNSLSDSPTCQVGNNDDRSSALKINQGGSSSVVVPNDRSRTPSPPCLFDISSDYELRGGDDSIYNEDTKSTTSTLSEPSSVEERGASRSPSPRLLCNSDDAYTDNDDERDVEYGPGQFCSILPSLNQQMKKRDGSKDSDDNRHLHCTSKKRKSRSSDQCIFKKRPATKTMLITNPSTTLSSDKDQSSYSTLSAKSSFLLKQLSEQKLSNSTKNVAPRARSSRPPSVVSPASAASDAVKMNQPVCKICGQSFSRSDNLQKHKRNVHKLNVHGDPIDPDVEWKCTKCTPQIHFAAYNYLQAHKKNFHSNPDASFNCTFCKKEFKTQTGQRQHQKRCRKNPGNKNTKFKKRQQRS